MAPAVIAVCLLPAIWGAGALTSDIVAHTRILGSRPVKELEHFLGEWVLRFLAATLCVTPIRRITKWNWLQKYRRRFGLLAFSYACLHVLLYAFLDVQLDWPTLVEDLMERWYITIGMTAFVILCALALTSTAASVRRLGKRWVTLHKGVYVASMLGIVHYWMSVKADIEEPAMYGAVFVALLAYRVWYGARLRSPHLGSSPSPPQSSTRSA